MFLAGVDISKTAYFIKAQSVWQRVTKLIPYDDVTRFDGIIYMSDHINAVYPKICTFIVKNVSLTVGAA